MYYDGFSMPCATVGDSAECVLCCSDRSVVPLPNFQHTINFTEADITFPLACVNIVELLAKHYWWRNVYIFPFR